MNIIIHQQDEQKIAQIEEDEVVVLASADDGFDLLASLAYEHDVSKFIINQENIASDFFVLHTKMAGHLLQKLANYKMQMAIVGDFRRVESESLRAFIAESNRGNLVFFVPSVAVAKEKLFTS